MYLKTLASLLCLMPCLLLAAIYETDRLGTILSHIEKERSTESFVICDIDNTLLQSSQQLGSVSWGENMIEELQKRGVLQQEAELVEEILWTAVHKHISVVALDPQTAEIIQNIHKMKCPLLMLTARSPAQASNTFRELHSIGIALTQPEKSMTLTCTTDALYEKGCLFASPFNRKSEVLISFFEAERITPKKVIYIDDKLHHVQDIEKALTQRGIECVGLHFKYPTAKFDAAQAEREWKLLPEIIVRNE